jgi:N-acetylmuramoyl-L-alanine amidase
VRDAGHGGYDPGSIGATGLQEKNVNLAVSLKLGEILKSQGHTIIYTRESDKVTWRSNVKEDLQARVDISSNKKADLFISIHCNSSKLSYLRGMETYYFGNSQSKLLAKAIQDSMVKDVKLTDRGTREENFYVIKNNSAVSVLVELGYISNSTEEKLLMDKVYQDRWASSIAKGINNYISSN